MRRGRSSSELPLRPAAFGGPEGANARPAEPAGLLNGVASDALAARRVLEQQLEL